MVHLGLNDCAVLLILEIEFNLYRVYFILFIYYKASVKNDLGDVFKLLCKFIYRIGRSKLLKGFL